MKNILQLRRFWVSLLFLAVPMFSSAYDFEVDGIVYHVNTGGKSVTVKTCTNKYSVSVVIPSSVTANGWYYTVTNIGERAFLYTQKSLTSVTLPSSVTHIDDRAFEDCSKLQSITLPGSVTSIGNYAFKGCSSLTSINIPNSVTSIGYEAFYDCYHLPIIDKLRYADTYLVGAVAYDKAYSTYNIKSGTRFIGSTAFEGCSELTSITIPEGVTTIESSAFEGCSALTSITIPEGVTTIEMNAFKNCSALTTVTIPSSVTDIDSYAFQYCSSLTKAVFSDIESLCNVDFGSNNANPLYYAHHLYISGKEVKDLVIPETVTDIGAYVFFGCSGLTSVVIPNSVTSIGWGAFKNCSGLTSVVVGDGVSSIEGGTFQNCSSLTSVKIGSGVTSIGTEAFENCSKLTSIIIPNIVTNIGKQAFYNCLALNSLTIGSGVTDIGSEAFYRCNNLKSLMIDSNELLSKSYSSSNNLKNIFGSQITECVIGDSVKSIGSYAFDGCNNLVSVTIGNGVKNIGPYAFNNCSSLTKAEFPSVESLCKISYGGISSNPLSYASHLYVDGEEVTNVVIPEGVTRINSRSFTGCITLTSVTVPNSVTSIESLAFSGCSALNSLTIGSGITDISSNAFYRCSSLMSVMIDSNDLLSKTYSSSSNLKDVFGSQVKEYIIGNNVTCIGDSAFSGCLGLTSVAIPESMTSIGHYAFSGCSGLTSITIPNNVSSIGGFAFYENKSLKTVKLGSGLTTIGVESFRGCSSLENVDFSECSKLDTIGNTSFYDCSSLKTLDLSNCVALTSIGHSTFYGCSSLTSVTIPNSVKSIGSYAFFRNTSLKTVKFGSGLITIGGESLTTRGSSFQDCSSLESVDFSECADLETIDINSFYGCSSLKNLDLSGCLALSTIGERSFSNCSSIEDVNLSNCQNLTSLQTALFYGCKGMKQIKLPQSLTTIGNSVFYGCSSLESLTIPSSVTLIGTNSYSTSSYTFEGCTGLKTLIFEDGADVITIGEGYYYKDYNNSSNHGMFYDCPLDSVYLGRPVAYPTYSSNQYLYAPFARNSKIKSVTLGSGLTFINDYLFYGCSSLSKLDMSRCTSLTNIGSNTFNGCSSLTSITIPESVTSIEHSAFYGCSSLTSVVIPNSVLNIGSYAFYENTSLKTVKLGSGLITIGGESSTMRGRSFQGCSSLESIDFSKCINLETIDIYSFYGCSSLGTIDLSVCSELKTIAEGAFYYCSSIEGLDLTPCQKLTSLQYRLFNGCSGLKWIKLPQSLTTISRRVFSGCSSLESLTIPSSVTLIGTNDYSTSSYTFEGCTGLKTLIFEDGADVITIGEGYYSNNSNSSNKGMFYDCPLQSVYLGRPVAYPTYSGYSYLYAPFSRNTALQTIVLGDGLNSIEQCLFYGCSNLSSVDLGDNVASVGQYAFYNCPKLQGIKLPEKINYIGNYAFAGTTVLQEIKCDIPSPISVSANVWSQNSYNGKLSVPVESLDSYMQATTWKDFSNISGHEGLQYDFIVDGIYYKILDLSALTCEVTYKDEFTNSYLQKSIQIPAKVSYNGRTFDVVSIGQRAFDGAIFLENIDIPSSIKSVCKDAFNRCISLSEMKLPNTIGDMQTRFNGLPLNIIHFYGDGSEIKPWFKGCGTLKEISFDCPNLTEIADSAFYECSSLKKISLPGTIRSIGEYAFLGCGFSEFEMPGSLKSMGNSAFQSCTKLASIAFTSPLTTIPTNGFAGCSSLTELIISSSIDSIANNAFKGCSSVSSLSINDSNEKIKLGRNIDGDKSYGLFSDCPLKEIYIGRDIIGETPFDINKSIENVEIGHRVTVFPDNSLSDLTQLSYLSIGNGITEIPSFSTCVNLREIVFGSHIGHLPDFSKCSCLEKITVRSAKPQSLESDFDNKVYVDGTLYVPKGSVLNYQNSDKWKNFFNINEYDVEHKATGLSFEQTWIEAYAGETVTLSPVVTPVDASEVFSWKSLDENLASVNDIGEVTLKNVGEAIITATTTDGSNITATCTINAKRVTRVEDIILEKSSVAVTINKEVKLEAKVSPSNVTYPALRWESSDDEIASVSQDGTVHANNVGHCSIFVKSTDGTNIVKECKVEVLPVYVSELSIIITPDFLVEGETLQLTIEYEPENATIPGVIWEVSNESIANIDDNGMLTSISPGTVKIIARTTDGSGVSAEKTLEVKPIVSSYIKAEINQSTGKIDLKWGASDYVKNTLDYNVYVSENGGPFILWLPNTTKTSASFSGTTGKSYRFTVSMRDKSGHVEKYDESKCVTINK